MLNKGGKACCALYPVTEEQLQQRGGQLLVAELLHRGGRGRNGGPGERIWAVPYSPAPSTCSTPAAWRSSRTPPERYSQSGSPSRASAPRCSASRAPSPGMSSTPTTSQRPLPSTGGLFGWQANAATGGGGAPYNVFTLEGQPACGMMAIREEWGPLPAQLVHLPGSGGPGDLVGTGEGDGGKRPLLAHGGGERGAFFHDTGPRRGVPVPHPDCPRGWIEGRRPSRAGVTAKGPMTKERHFTATGFVVQDRGHPAALAPQGARLAPARWPYHAERGPGAGRPTRSGGGDGHQGGGGAPSAASNGTPNTRRPSSLPLSS